MQALPQQYPAPKIDRAWADSRETHIAVATAIHAISDDSRTPEQIWEDPTPAEWDHVCAAVENYISAGIFQPEDDAHYPWGCETVVIEQ